MTDLQERIEALPPDKRARLERMLADKAATAQVDRPIPARGSAAVELSFAQRREWLTEQLRGSNNMRGAVRLSGRLDVELLRRIVRELVARHEVLRTNVELRSGAPVAVVRPPGDELDLPVVDLSGTPRTEHPAELDRLVHEEACRPFDVESDVLMRGVIIRLAPDEHILLLTTHHMASDGWSQGILVTEIAALHEAFRDGGESTLTPLALQYADFAAWQQDQLDQGGFEPHLEYWRTQLAGMPPRLALPIDHPHPPEPSFSGATYRHSLSATARDGVDRLVKQIHASPFMVMLAALKTLMYRFTGQTDIVVGAPIAGRNRPELEPVMGCFVNVLLLRTHLSGADTFDELLRQVRTATLDGYEHQDLPYERLIDDLQPKRDRAGTPLIQLMFNFDNLPLTPVELTGVTMTPMPVDWDGVNVELALLAQQDADGTTLVWQYDTELFEPETVADLSRHLERILEAVIVAPQTRLDDIALTDRAAATADVTTAGPDARDAESVHRAVERWASRTPEAAAVVCAGQAMSYRELDRRANRIAHLLRDRGAGRGAVVGVCTGSSFRLAEAVLGVLKAGAAFLPLDPRDPVARTRFLLDDLEIRTVLTDPETEPLLHEPGVATVMLDDDATATRGRTETDQGIDVGSRDIAYAIYTSGSTGTPKGVLVEHGALLEYAKCFAGRLGIGPADRFLQFASPGFDVLVEELFPTWLAGATVVMMPAETRGGAPADLVRLLAAERVTLAELPTALWHEWADVADRPGQAPPESLRMVVVGGERVLRDRLAAWARTGVALTHVYGLTETTVTSTTFTPGPEDWASANLPIGSALANTALYVLDTRMRPVPKGAPGELFVGGTGVARGYVNQPGLTAERFLPDPFAARAGARMYRTGDLVRVRTDGNLEFLSRVDRQVKIRGYRIELAEIEAALVRCTGIRQAVVTVREVTEGDRRL
ncbi:non-ribosomal peptide synthetase, partial [Actinophytocola sp.]|uniref:non-ribosomal peptide synthetase n=1 Tax=Actinophytocola sp. TaxID=1872138 RepID=UPI003D6BD864